MNLNNRFKDYLTDGSFFDYLDAEMFGSPAVPLLFFGNHGAKEESPMLENVADVAEDREDLNKSTAAMLKAIFANKWARLYAVTQSEYNPIENYRMVENESVERSIAESESGDVTTTKSGTDVTESESEDATAVYGFNGATPSPSDESTSSGTNTQTLDLTDSTSHSKETESGEDTSRELTRSGNIGVTTSQQMLQSEIELWRWNFLQEAFADIASVFAMKIY